MPCVPWIFYSIFSKIQISTVFFSLFFVNHQYKKISIDAIIRVPSQWNHLSDVTFKWSIILAFISGCLPNSRNAILQFFLNFPPTFSSFPRPFVNNFYFFSSTNFIKIRNFRNLSKFRYFFFYKLLFSNNVSLISLTFYLNSLTFPWFFQG